MLLGVIMFLTIWWAVVRWKRKNTKICLPKELQIDRVALPFIGHTYLFMGSLEDVMTTFKMFGRTAIEKGGVALAMHCSTPYIIVADPMAAEVIMKNCHEKGDEMNVTRELLGNGTLVAPVSIWRSRRKALVPTFSMKNLTTFVDTFAKQSGIMVKQLAKVEKGVPFSSWKYHSAYAMDSVCQSTLGFQVHAQENPSSEPFLVAIEESFRILAHIMMKPWLNYPFIYTKLQCYKTMLKHKRYVDELINKIIKDKRSQSKEVRPQNADKEVSLKTFADLLVQSKDSTVTDDSIREECMVITFGGTDTSAVGTGFTTVLLANHQDVQEKVVEELKEVFGDSTRPVEADDLHRLKYLGAVIKESLRLYPPIPIVTRILDIDLELPSGVTIPKGCGAAINIWAIHRNPKYWGEDADEFRPERFLDAPARHPAAFISFGYGHRGCIGYQYAMMSMKTVLATLLREYRVAPATDHEEHGELRVKLDFMMRHVGDYRVRLYPRK